VVAKYEIHNLLVNECSVRIVDETDGSILKTILLNNIDKIECTSRDTAIVELPPLRKTMLEKQIAKIQIWHNGLGLVSEDSINSR
jgi:hypothetical protein